MELFARGTSEKLIFRVIWYFADICLLFSFDFLGHDVMCEVMGVHESFKSAIIIKFSSKPKISLLSTAYPFK